MDLLIVVLSVISLKFASQNQTGITVSIMGFILIVLDDSSTGTLQRPCFCSVNSQNCLQGLSHTVSSPLSAGGNIFQFQILKKMGSKRKRVPWGLKEFLQQIFAWSRGLL